MAHPRDAGSLAVIDARPRPSRTAHISAALAVAVVALTTLTIQFAIPQQAVAIIASTRTGHIVSYQPVRANAPQARSLARPRSLHTSTSNYKPCQGEVCLDYYGGPVMRTATLTPIFWNPAGLGLAYPAGYKAEVEQFLSNLEADSGKESNFYSVLTQYDEGSPASPNVTYSVKAKAGLDDTDALPSGLEEQCTTPIENTSRPCVTDKGVRSELEAFINAQHLQRGIGHEYIVFFPQGIDSCFDAGGAGDEKCSGTGYCGYHGALKGGTSEEVEYANEPDNGDLAYKGGCTAALGQSAAFQTINTTSHELSESVTDPEVAEPSLSWYDENKLKVIIGGNPYEFEYGEVGDMCAWEFAQGDGALGIFSGEGFESLQSNQTINGQSYLLQTEWDNAHSTCSLSEDAASTKALFTGNASTPRLTGEAIAFDASSSHAPVPIEAYEWNWGDGSSPSSSSSAQASHSYASAQGQPSKSYVVTLKITDANGNTATTTGAVEIEDRKPLPAFSTPAATAQTPVTFDGSTSSDSDGSIASYSWSFGDNGSASGATPTHTYSTPGQYTVTLTVTDDAGMTATVSRTVTVADAPPSASLAVSTAAPAAGTPIGFDGSGSKDVDGSVVNYAWSFGDGTSGSGSQSQHVYTKAGTYTVKLTVTDNSGLTASAERTIVVQTPSNVFEVLNVKSNKKDGSALLTVRVPGPGRLSATDASSAHGSIFSSIASSFADWQTPTAHSAKSKHKHTKSIALVKPASASASESTTLTLRLLPTSAAQKQLSRRHKLSAKVVLAFTPTDGIPGTRTQSVVLWKAKTKRRHE